MTINLTHQHGRASESSTPGRIFTRFVRRDLTDLNRQYLELGLRADAGSDPLFAWTDGVRREIEAADFGIRERMAGCPFTLFELRLPAGDCARDGDFWAELDRVEDRPSRSGEGDTRPAGCVAFAHGALFTACRLVDSAPLAARIAFGLSPDLAVELNETSPTRIAMLARHPGVVRARWPCHSRFWSMLRAAAQSGVASMLQSAHCAGVCLMDGQRGDATVAEPAARRCQPQR